MHNFTLVRNYGNGYFASVDPKLYEVASGVWEVPFRYKFGFYGKLYEAGLPGDVIKKVGNADYEIYTDDLLVFSTASRVNAFA